MAAKSALASRPVSAPASYPLNWDAIDLAFRDFHRAEPFDHCIVDDFITDEDLLDNLANEFPPYDSPAWFVYKNAIEDKKALNSWDFFPPATYKFFSYLNTAEFTDYLGAKTDQRLYADSGLNGGGWHCHGTGGNLNPHVDYSIHPKLGLQRKINIILYLSRELKEEHGGHLGFWKHDAAASQPGKLIREIAPRFNRAVIFDTTQNSWHGLSRPLSQPQGIYRKSLAVYYMCEPPADADRRGRALFAPRENQKGDPQIEELIRLRADVRTSGDVYRQPVKKD